MLYKQLFRRDQAGEKVVPGRAAPADPVRVTLSPKSKCVRFGKKSGLPLVCNDGVTIAKEVDIKDAGENPGAQRVREAQPEGFAPLKVA
jgi:chaperonin GroEL